MTRRRFRMPADLFDRWTLRVVPAGSGCWEWLGATWKRGYGKFTTGSRRVSAHRWGYEQMVGPVPAGHELDHLCRNHACVNPDHLEPVTHLVNVRRGRAGEVNGARGRAVAACPKGHPYDTTNTYFAARGSRNCRACGRARAVARRARCTSR